MKINETVEWAQLYQHQRATRFLQMRDLFEQDKHRFENFHEKLDNGFWVDYSKNRITEESLSLLINLANAANLQEKITSMLHKESINESEHRPVLHIHTRLPQHHPNAIAAIHTDLERALNFAEQLRQGKIIGTTGKALKKIVHLGIGGSNLGMQMLTQALNAYRSTHIDIDFVANIDRTEIDATLAKLNAEETLFIIASKSFNTPETLSNALIAKKWLQQRLSVEHITAHLAAISCAPDAAFQFGVARDRIFTIPDGVGGRYSGTSVMSLPLMCAIGKKHFCDFLAGAHTMDKHFIHAPLRHNTPVLLALIGIWYNTFYRAHSHAVIPYAHALRRLPAHLQQLDMESNGKQVSKSGDFLDFDTGPIIWGEEGVNCQHAFFQLLHQGSRLIPCDFIVVARGENGEKQPNLVANAIAQTRALMMGRSEAEVYRELSYLSAIERDQLAPQKYFNGNRPSNTIFIDSLTPHHIGMLLALYEHKVFVQASIWGINPFDQWGVEYGKILAQDIASRLNQPSCYYDSSTNALMNAFIQS